MLHAIRRFPLSLLLSTIMVGSFVAARATGHDPAYLYGTPLPYRPSDWRVLTSGMTTLSVQGLLAALLAMSVVAVGAERVLGTRRLGLVVAATQIFVVPAGLIAAQGVEDTGLNWWGADIASTPFLSPLPWMYASVAVASAFMPLLWMRRTRTILGALSLSLALYAGTTGAIISLMAVICGVIAGNSWARRQGVDPFTRQVGGASLRETRTLIAVASTAVALGPVFTALSSTADGILSYSAHLLWAPDVAFDQMQINCAQDPTVRACVDALAIFTHRGLANSLATLMPVVLQVIVALGLRRGRRTAWWLAVLVQLGSMVLVLAQLNIADVWPEEPVLTAINLVFLLSPWLVLLGVLVARRRFFTVRTDGSVLWKNIGTSAAWCLAMVCLWIGGATLTAHGFDPVATWPRILADIPARFAPTVVSDLWENQLLPQTWLTWLIFQWCGLGAWAGVCWQTWRLLNHPPAPAREEERRRARALLHQGTGDHLSWMTLWPGNNYWFDPSGGGYVAYRLAHGVAVTVGGPVVVGPSSMHKLSRMAQGFEEFTTARGWSVAWYSVNAEFRAVMEHRGWASVHVAEEAVLTAEQVGFKGKKFQNIRTAINRAQKEDVRAVWTTWRNAGAIMQEKMVALSEEWVGEKSLPEMSFTLGGIEEMQDSGTHLLLAVGADGHLHGMTSWLPVYESGSKVGLTLDVMRRDAGGFRPTIEFLLAEGLIHAVEEGLGWVSLSGAPLAPPSDPEQTTGQSALVGTALDYVGQRMEPLYGFRSLAASKYKFHPEHHGWYLCYSDELGLPAIGLAVAQCYLPTMKPRELVEAVRVLRGKAAG